MNIAYFWLFKKLLSNSIENALIFDKQGYLAAFIGYNVCGLVGICGHTTGAHYVGKGDLGEADNALGNSILTLGYVVLLCTHLCGIGKRTVSIKLKSTVANVRALSEVGVEYLISGAGLGNLRGSHKCGGDLYGKLLSNTVLGVADILYGSTALRIGNHLLHGNRAKGTQSRLHP